MSRHVIARRGWFGWLAVAAAFALAPARAPDRPPATGPATSPATAPVEHRTFSTVRRFFGHADGVEAVAITGDGSIVASAGADQTVRLWDAATGRELRRMTGHASHVNHLSISADGRRLLSGSVDRTARVWAVPSGDLIAVLQGHAAHVHCQSISADGKVAATGSCDETVRVWDVDGERSLYTIGVGSQPRAVAVSPDGKMVVVSSGVDTAVTAYDVATQTQVKRLRTFEQVMSLSFSPDGSRLYAARRARAGDSTLQIFDGHTFAEIRSVDYRGSTSVFSVSADGTRGLTMEGWAAHLIDLASGESFRSVLTGGPTCNDAALSANGRFAVACGGGRGDPYGRSTSPAWARAGQNDVSICDLAAPPPAAVREVALPAPSKSLPWVSPDGRLAAIPMAANKGWQVLELPSLKFGARLTAKGDGRPAFSADGRRIAIPQGRTVEVFDTASGERVGEWKSPRGGVVTIAFAGDRLVVARAALPGPNPGDEAPGEVCSIEPQGAQVLWRSAVATGSFPSVAGSGDGRWVVARVCKLAAPSEASLLWLDASTGAEVGHSPTPGGPLKFGATGDLAVTAGESGIQFWKPCAQEPASAIDCHYLSDAQFSVDGSVLKVEERDEPTVLLWDVANGRVRKRIDVTVVFDGERGKCRKTCVLLPDGRAGYLAVKDAQVRFVPVDAQ